MFNATSCLKVRFKVPKSGPNSDGGLKRKRDAFNNDANRQKFICSGAFTSRFYGENIEHLCPGCHVEVLSQDSGIRGCWFRCLILNRHKDKIKVRYLELQDADETGNLEEWVLLTRIAKPDQLGVRFLGRPMVRPQHVEESKASCFDVGAIVDAWWHGGWWEGIVLCQGGRGRLQVYFPGEKRITEFGEDELRYSLEWVGNKWNPLKGRKDIAHKLTSTADRGSEYLIGKQDHLNFDVLLKPEPQLEGLQYDKRGIEKSSVTTISRDQKRVLADLTNDLKLDSLRWRPRKRSRRSGSRKQSDTSSGSSSGDMDLSSPGPSGFCQLNLVPDDETCKSSGEQPFMGVPVQVPNLVMSR
ncbi:agenet domain-containing protein / bromo-adjacent homology (BAH) domain-containing protein [Zea mays]|nr:agenet domain-containing protein / bromo-adjacent homology (BAH) domain-containing protein [Zea mays]ONM04659.1 agenet domain-containing protein / bromo-adjacent homology (BAH) domain-containing protein [Zea mays]